MIKDINHPFGRLLLKPSLGSLLASFLLAHLVFSGMASAAMTFAAVRPSCGPGVDTQLQKCISYLGSCGFARGPQAPCAALVPCPELHWLKRGQSVSLAF